MKPARLFLQTNMNSSQVLDVYYQGMQVGSIEEKGNQIEARFDLTTEYFDNKDDALDWIQRMYITLNRRHAEIIHKRATTMLARANLMLEEIDNLNNQQ